MKKIILFFIFIFITQNSSADIVYIDINFIIKNSKVGKSLSEYHDKLVNDSQKKFKIIENELMKKEKQLIAQQNIIKKDEFQKRFNILSEEVKNFRSDINANQKNLDNEKIKNTKKILEILNPIITQYVESNSISLVIPKKNIIVGKKNLDITDQIIKLLNDKISKLNF